MCILTLQTLCSLDHLMRIYLQAFNKFAIIALSAVQHLLPIWILHNLCLLTLTCNNNRQFQIKFASIRHSSNTTKLLCAYLTVLRIPCCAPHPRLPSQSVRRTSQTDCHCFSASSRQQCFRPSYCHACINSRNITIMTRTICCLHDNISK